MEKTTTIQVIKESNPKIEIRKPAKKTVLLCFNGFQNSDTHDALPMADYFQKAFKGESDFDVVPVRLFSPSEKKTHHPRYFEKEARKAIEKYHALGYDVALMGYSFSCSLACKMQAKYPFIHRMILAAPIYDTILRNMIPHYIRYAMKFAKLKKKYGSRVSKVMGRQTTKGMIGLLLSIMNSILQDRKYIRKVKDCDVLLLWGEEDLLCTEHSVTKFKDLLSCEKMLYRYPTLDHCLIKSLRDDGAVYEDVFHFVFGTPYKIEKSTLSVSPSTHRRVRVKYDEDGEPIPTFAEIFSSMDPEGDRVTFAEQKDI